MIIKNKVKGSYHGVRLGSTCKEEKGLGERQWGVEVGAQAC